jgi:hypothetical protein
VEWVWQWSEPLIVGIFYYPWKKTNMATIRLPENKQKLGKNYQDRPALCRLQLKRADKFWTLVPHNKTRKNIHINIRPETFSF